MSQMPKIRDLQQELGEVADRQRKLILDYPKGLPADKQTEFDTLEKRASEIEKQFENIKSTEKVASLLSGVDREGFNPAKTTDEEREIKHLQAFKGFLQSGGSLNGLSEEERAILLPNDRAQSGANPGTGTTGGILIPTTLGDQLEKILKAYGGVMPIASYLSTSSGNPFDYPTNDDTANKGSIVGESASVGSGTDAVFGKVSFTSYKYTSGQVLIPFELIRDSQFDIISLISELVGTRIARAINEHFTKGTGSSQPQGVTVGGTSFTTGVSGTAISYANLVDLVTSLDPAYANSNCRFMFNSNTLGAIRKLVDSQNRPLWTMGDMINGVPNTILGIPYVVNQDMPDIALSAKSIVFGDFSKYKIRKVGQPRMRVLNELNALNDQVGVLAFDTYDGKVLVPKALRVLTHAAS